jgi:cellulose biosynthesis protein BcsQ
METLKILIVSQKGGVGKSTLSANLAVWFSENCYKSTVLIDLDPHGSSSQWIKTARLSQVHTEHFIASEFGERRWLIDSRNKIRKHHSKSEIIITDLTWSSALDAEFMHEFDLVIVPTSVSTIELSATINFLDNIKWVFETRDGIPPTLLLCPSRVMPYELSDDPFSKEDFPLPFMLLPPLIHDDSVRKLFKHKFIIDDIGSMNNSFTKCAQSILQAGIIHKQSASSIKLKHSEKRFLNTHNTKLSRYMSKKSASNTIKSIKKEKFIKNKLGNFSGFSKIISSVLSNK